MTLISTPPRSAAAGLWLVLGMLTSAPAWAESPQTSRSAGRADVGTAEDRWRLGAGAAVLPVFQGAEEYEVQPVPLVDIRYGRLFAKTGDGIGVDIIRTGAITAGLAVNWMTGYDADDMPRGIDGADDALGARLFLSARLRGMVATLAATQAITETDRGLLIAGSLAYPIRATDRLTITPALGATWANARYMTGYFGITATEAAASGLPRYEPAAGLKDVSLRIAAAYRITDNISAVGSVGVVTLLGDAADSPLVERETTPIALLGLTYSF